MNYESLIPPEAQHLAMSYAHPIETNERALGMLAADLCDELVGRELDGEVITRYMVCSGVALYAEGRTPGQVMDLEYCMRYIPKIWWDAFPQLYRNHGKALIPHCKQPLDYIDLTAAWIDEAKTLSVASLRAWLQRRDGAPPAWEGRKDRLVALCESLVSDIEAPGWLREAARWVIGKVNDDR